MNIDLFDVIENRDWDSILYQEYRLNTLGLHKFLQNTTFLDNQRHRESIQYAINSHRNATGLSITVDIRRVEREAMPDRYKTDIPNYAKFCLIGYSVGSHQTYKPIAHPFIGDDAYESYLQNTSKSAFARFPSLNENDYFKRIELSEKQMEKYFCDYLFLQGKTPAAQIYCDYGIIDVIDNDNNIYEIKKRLTKANVNRALLQLLGYKNSEGFNDKNLFIVGEMVEGVENLYKEVKRYGITIIHWDAMRISKELNIRLI